MTIDVFLRDRQVVDFQDKVGSVSVPANSTGTNLTFDDGAAFFTTRTGLKPFLTNVSNDVDPGGENKIRFHLKVNGTRINKVPFDSFVQSLGETYKSDARLPYPIELPQGALIEIEAENSDGSTAYNAYSRLRVEYESLN